MFFDLQKYLTPQKVWFSFHSNSHNIFEFGAKTSCAPGAFTNEVNFVNNVIGLK